MKSDKFIFLLFLAIGLLFVGFALKGIARNISLYLKSDKTTAVVTRVDRNVDEEGSKYKVYYTPLLEFEAQGKKYKLSADPVSDPAQFVEGKTFPIRYYQNDPWKAKVDTFDELWLAPILLSLFGIVFSGLGGGIFWMTHLPVGETASSFQTGFDTQVDQIPSTKKILLTEKLKPIIRKGQVIEAIKMTREELKCGLKEAKDFVDSIET